MKLLSFFLLTFAAIAADVAPVKPTPPVLTEAQKLAIVTALYDNESLNPGREAIGKAEEKLRAALGSCGTGFVVGRDPATHEFNCVVPPAPPAAAKP